MCLLCIALEPRDSKLDIVISGGGTAWLYKNGGTALAPSFTRTEIAPKYSSTYLQISFAISVYVGRIDSDNSLDVAVLSWIGGDVFWSSYSSTTQSFTPQKAGTPLTHPSWTTGGGACTTASTHEHDALARLTLVQLWLATCTSHSNACKLRT